MDYRELLKKYMQHVFDCEGTTFVRQDSYGFTEDELAALMEIDRELEE